MTDLPARLLLRRLRTLGFASLLVFSSPYILAQDSGSTPQLTEKTSQELQKLQPLLDAKNWDGAIALLNALRAIVPPNSYDTAMITDILGKIYLQKNEYGKSIEPLEASLRISDANNFFDVPKRLETVYFLAQVYYQQAAETKNPAEAQQSFAKALTYLQRWMKETPKVTDDALSFYANLLYNRAVANPDKIDHALLEEAKKQCIAGLHLSARPKDQFYILLLACLQQESNLVESAKILEILVSHTPTNKTYWQQLASTYLNLGTDKNPQRALEYNLRAIVTIERAQALGIMTTPKDNYNLVGVYFNIGQFGKATELLEKGLREGSIENDQKNWELLAYSLQQIHKEFAAIDALKEAAKRFPQAGQLDFQIAQICYSLNNTEEAYRYLQSATTKGHLERPGSAYGFMAYLAFDLKRLDEALTAVNKAIEMPDAKSDTQLPQLRGAIQDAINARNAEKAAAAAPADATTPAR